MIYFAQPTNGGPIRIGCSSNADARRRTLGVWIPGGVETILELEGGFLGEHILHHCFNPIRVERDWFRSCDTIWKFIIEAKARRPRWLSRTDGDAERFEFDAIMDEFGGSEKAAKALGYLSATVFEQSVRLQTKAGFGLSSRVHFYRLLMSGKLPSYISDLHFDHRITASEEEAAA